MKNKIKKFRIIIVSLSLLLLLPSCKDWLNIEPENAVKKIIKTEIENPKSHGFSIKIDITMKFLNSLNIMFGIQK